MDMEIDDPFGPQPSTSRAAAEKECFCCKGLVRPRGVLTEEDFLLLMNPDNFRLLEKCHDDTIQGLIRFAAEMELGEEANMVLQEGIASERVELCADCGLKFRSWLGVYREMLDTGLDEPLVLVHRSNQILATMKKAVDGMEERNQLERIRTSLITQGGITKMQMRHRHRMGMEIRPPIVSSKNARRFLKTGNGDRGPRKNMARRTDFSGPGGRLGLSQRYADAKAAPGIPSEGSEKPSIVKQYSCLQCPLRFENLDNLQAHTFIHKLGFR